MSEIHLYNEGTIDNSRMYKSFFSKVARFFGGGGRRTAPAPAPIPVQSLGTPPAPTGGVGGKPTGTRGATGRPKGKTTYTSTLGLSQEARSGINLKTLTGM